MQKLKILLFYRYDRYYNKDEWLHLHFAKAISEHPEIELKIYGLYIEDIYPNLMLMPYSSSIVMEDILKKFSPDVIIGMTKARLFREYNPKQSFKGNLWLPSGWHNARAIPKIILEEDYFCEENDDWYKEYNIDLILQRHYSQAIREVTFDEKPKHIWFPFSVDAEIFKPNKELRKNRICFVGANGATYYIHRRKAINCLRTNNAPLDIFANNEKIGKEYIKCLQEYDCHLNGSLIYNTTPAKMFEIMACGSVLLTSENEDLKLLFDEGSYVTYNEYCSDLLAKANKILKDETYRNNIIEKALRSIQSRHTHKIRVNELLDIIKREFNL